MFVSQALTGRTLVPGTEIRLAFDIGYTATAGCNTLTGAYRFDDDVLVVASMESTTLACDAARQEQDAWLAGFLLSRPTTVLDDPRLTLVKDVTSLAMLDREIASPDRPLVGTQWIGSKIDTGSGVMTTGADLARLSVGFAADGTFQASSGCQRANGTIVSNKATIYFTTLQYDGGICPDSDLEPTSQSFLFVLNGMEVSFAIEERELKISRAGMTLYFNSAQ